MARIRTIKPEFWEDEKIGSLSLEARLSFIAMWNLADDEGLLKANPLYLKSQIFPYDDVSKEDIENILGMLQEQDLIFIYKDMKQQQYCWIVNFRKHQRIDKPQKAKHPLPSLQNPRVREMYGHRDGWVCQICSEEINHPTENKSLCLSVDHIKPRSAGGCDNPSNIRAVHFGCNASKKDKDYSQSIPRTIEDGKERKGKDQGKEQVSLKTSTSTSQAKIDPREDEINGIFEYWRKTMNKDSRAKLTQKRKSKVNARLEDGFTPREICLAIKGCAMSPHHMGDNDTGAIYDDLELICRDDAKVKRFISIAQKQQQPYSSTTAKNIETLNSMEFD